MLTAVTRVGRWTGWSLAALLSVAVALFSYRYLPRAGFLAPDILANLFARPWLDVHVAGAATALLVGSFQFIPALRRRWPAGHRWNGRIYAMGCLVGGLGGFMLAFGSTKGPIATAGFASLGLIWIFVTAMGWRTALQRRLVEHRRWMIRSWALTLAAVTLRLYLVALPLVPVSPLDGYRAISFLAWVPNLILAELYLRRRSAS
jgi:hypothetical protein